MFTRTFIGCVVAVLALPVTLKLTEAPLNRLLTLKLLVIGKEIEEEAEAGML